MGFVWPFRRTEEWIIKETKTPNEMMHPVMKSKRWQRRWLDAESAPHMLECSETLLKYCFQSEKKSQISAKMRPASYYIGRDQDGRLATETARRSELNAFTGSHWRLSESCTTGHYSVRKWTDWDSFGNGCHFGAGRHRSRQGRGGVGLGPCWV